SSSGDVRVRLRTARLVSCARCGSWTYFPRLNSVEQARLHDDHEYFQHPYFRTRREDQSRAEARCAKAFDYVSAATDVTSVHGERLLDIGCDTGTFLKVTAD